MSKLLVCAVLVLLLTACPGGWRTVMVSNFSLTPPPPGVREYPKYYPALDAPSAVVDDVLLLQWGSSNPHDLAYKEPVDAVYHISGYVSGKTDDISVDLSSFVLDNLEGSGSLTPNVSLAPKRVKVNIPLQGERTVCDFGPEALATVTGMISVPKYDGTEWPPKDIDHSILCVLLDFKISIREISPDKRFQLHFRYFVGGVAKEATLYFYPIKYRYFQS